MNDLENYKAIIETIFGEGVATFDVNLGITNNVISALNNKRFANFKACFIERLNRLNRVYLQAGDNRREIIHRINLIVDKNNWEGAYSELTAYDFINKEKDFLPEPLNLNNALKKNETFAGQMGKNEANLDGFFKDYDVFCEVKSLKDNVDDILQGIYNELRTKIAFNNFLITAEYPLDISYSEIQKNRSNILSELLDAIDVSKKIRYLKSQTVDKLSFKLLWESGTLTAERTYNPFRHAKNYYKIVFKYAHKFTRNKPFFLVFVIFPWFNGIINEFKDSNKIFYRSFARRVFCQYRGKDNRFSELSSDFKGEESIFNISKKLSGILFLEDESITSMDSEQTNIKSYFYLNPNADNHLMNSLFENIIFGLRLTEFDDFRFDNY